MLDIGIIGKEKIGEYDTKYLTELIPGEEISGKIYIGEIKKGPLKNQNHTNFM